MLSQCVYSKAKRVVDSRLSPVSLVLEEEEMGIDSSEDTAVAGVVGVGAAEPTCSERWETVGEASSDCALGY